MTARRTGVGLASDCSGGPVVDVLRSALAGVPLGCVEAVVPIPVRIAVYGSPGPQGSKRHVGGGRMIESSKKVRPWRQDVKGAAEAYRRHHGLPVLDGPLRVRMVFTLPKPAGAPKRRQTWPMRMPDLSKLVRSTEDALTDAGLWADDARVVECFSAKRYPGEGIDALDAPGCVIVVESIKA